ncbi:MAG TPA: TonB-dependent receptor [Steroidobacteraceae bacterium]|nr:TonB-dependent receptor [Steroidobacteraceae bacterium]
MRQSLALFSCIAPALLAAPLTVQAADETIERIIVTAQKRETDLQDVPFSVSATSQEQIRNSGAANVIELSRNVAGLIMTDLGPGQSQVAIRGISAGQVIRDQPGVKESVGVYLDESPVSIALFTPDLDLFDLDRLEVLRGPQGTLFGAGSSSGTIRYITRQPQLKETEGSAELTAQTGTTSEFGMSAKAAFNLPLGETAALRMVGYNTELPGFIDSYYPGRDVREDVNGGSRRGGRLALRFQPSETLSITPRLVYPELETEGYPRIDVYSMLGNPYTTTQSPVNPGERGQVTQFEEGIDDQFTLADLTIEVGLGGLTLTSVTSYTDRDVVVLRDASQLTGSITYQLAGTPAEVRFNSPLYDMTDLQALSQEVRVASDSGGALEWLVGAFYQDVDRKYGQNLPTPGYDAFLIRVGEPPNTAFGAPADNPYFSRLEYDFKQFGVFGEATMRFNEQWSLTGGLRYYDFDEDRFLTFAGYFFGPEYINNTRTPGSTSSDGFSPRVILAFEPSEDVLLTAQVSRGFRLGGINDPLNENLCSAVDEATFGNRPTWEDEKVLNYELGAKTQLAGGRIQFNAALFYSDIDGLQVVADAGSCSSRVVLNAQAESVGAEIELFAQPTENWDLGLSATYADAQITESQFAQGAPIAGIREGNQLPTSPKFQAAANATFMQPIGALEGYVNFTVQHVGSSYTQLADQEPGFGCVGCPGAPGFFAFGDPTISRFTFDGELPDYQIGNMRFGVRSGQFDAAVFINNVWDERAFLSLDRERGTRARVGYLTNVPRTYGVTARFNF